MTGDAITIALPKGRILDRILEHFSAAGLSIDFSDRKLVARNESFGLEAFLVKNSDLPVYVRHGIAGLGICGEDVLYEADFDLLSLLPMPFGSTRMCLAGRADESSANRPGPMRIATKFTRFARDYFHKRGTSVEIIKLGGSVELAPVLGLTPYIVDLVETGNTLRANNLEVIEELARIEVKLIANPAYYKLHFTRIDELCNLLAVEEAQIND
jgi:ATP phosphoribosyltransferase